MNWLAAVTRNNCHNWALPASGAAGSVRSLLASERRLKRVCRTMTRSQRPTSPALAMLAVHNDARCARCSPSPVNARGALLAAAPALPWAQSQCTRAHFANHSLASRCKTTSVEAPAKCGKEAPPSRRLDHIALLRSASTRLAFSHSRSQLLTCSPLNGAVGWLDRAALLAPQPRRPVTTAPALPSAQQRLILRGHEAVPPATAPKAAPPVPGAC